MTKQDPTPPVPWWKHGHVWLVISGPAIVVFASLVTGWVAMRHQDPVLDADYQTFLTSPKLEDRKAAWAALEKHILGDEAYMVKVSDFGNQYAESDKVEGLKPWFTLRFWDVSVKR